MSTHLPNPIRVALNARRERIATVVLARLAGWEVNDKAAVKGAVKLADALIEELDKPREGSPK